MASETHPRRPNAWGRALQLAERTPDSRNRYVDFLRAVSIGVVVFGHWLMAAPSMDRGELTLSDMLHLTPWTQWLTWVFMVMPLFFIVGGYSNGISWEAARRDGRGYGEWIGARMRRLLGPLVPLLLAWAGIAAVAHQLGVSPAMIRIGSQVALIPTWFLAVYVMVVIATPATHALWRRFGIASFWGLAVGAAVVDAVAFSRDLPLLRWANYGFVWLGVHHLGYAWRDGRLGGPGRALLWSAGGLGLLFLLVFAAGYPLSMLTVPGDEVSNSRPPTLALLALGVFHGGLLLALEAPARRWLQRTRPWAATVLVNGTIMTLYLWHVTAMVLLVGLANLLGGIGLGYAPGSAAWWASRPVWIGLCALVLAGFIAIFGRYEQTARTGRGAAPSAWLAGLGAAAVCVGLAALALGGVWAPGVLGIRLGTLVLTLAGAALAMGVSPGRSAPAAGS